MINAGMHHPDYDERKPIWDRCRAICAGESEVKKADRILDTTTFRNFLLPFSPSMSQQQYDFFRAEAELPGIVSEFAKLLLGGLLRKSPTLDLPDNLPADAKDWLLNDFGMDGCTLAAFLDSAIWEELQTSRAWVFVDYPSVENYDNLTTQEVRELKPFPVLWKAENIINWRTEIVNGRQVLQMVVVQTPTLRYVDDFKTKTINRIYVHELVGGQYQVRVLESEGAGGYTLVETRDQILKNGQPLTFIPAWPLNGSIQVSQPLLKVLCDKEVALYNKLSRRNHLLYGAATYTPVVTTDMSDDAFREVVSGGLGTWIRLNQGDTASVLKTPTEALQDMDRAVASGIEEMARLGIRMLSPETAQSGIALEIRNASQTARLGALNTKVSDTLKQVMALMLSWRYDMDIPPGKIQVSLSDDFNPIPIGADWLRLATEWYEAGHIPRWIWINLLKQNELIPPEYNDEQGRQDITQDQGFLQGIRPPKDNQFVE